MIAVHDMPGAFSPDECDALVEAAEAAGRRPGRLLSATGGAVRRAGLTWLDDMADCAWAMDRLTALFARANRDCFGFILTEFAESAQVARYGADEEGHYDWHADIGSGPLAERRKLTLVVQLSPPETYVGGGLEIRPSGTIRQASRSLGAAVVFPSYLLHRVAPVTQGERVSLTLWAHGPAFR